MARVPLRILLAEIGFNDGGIADDVAWRAVHEGVLTHVCLHYQPTARHPQTGDIVGADFVDVSLADSGVHMTAARVLEAWEE